MIPEWFTEEAQQIVKSGILKNGESIIDGWTRVANTANRHLRIPGFTRDLLEALTKGYIGTATPVLANLGTKKGLPISCNSLHVSDTLDSVGSHAKELMKLTQMGAGVGCFLGDIRPAGSPISSGGTHDGVTRFALLYDKVTQVISQGNCYAEDTEILTNRGWVNFKYLLEDDLVAQVNRGTQKTEFVKPLEIIEQDAPQQMIRVFSPKRHGVDLLVTPNHKMVQGRLTKKGGTKRWGGELKLVPAEKVKYHRDNKHFLTFPLESSGGVLTPMEQFQIAYQADGGSQPAGNSNSSKSGYFIYIFHFAKKRKIDRLCNICTRANIPYRLRPQKDGTTNVLVWLKDKPSKKFDWLKLDQIDCDWCRDFIEELKYWDGKEASRNCISYGTIERENIDVVQAIASLGGYKTTLRETPPQNNKKRFYEICVNKINSMIGGDSLRKETISNYQGKVYCVEVPSNIIIVRRNGQVSVCGNTRRGSAAYGLPVRHKDTPHLLHAKDHNIADPRGILDGNVFVTIQDEFMEKLISGGEEEKELMNLCHKTRLESGSPYLVFIDNINNQNPISYRNNNLHVSTTNICSEITLFTNEDHTFVCCLSSLNLAKWEEWKSWRSPNLGFTVPQLCTYLLDAVLSEYIIKAKKIASMGRAIRSAEKGRAIGVGVMGLHDLFQQKMLPFGSKKAKRLSEDIQRHIRAECDKASRELAQLYGEPLWCEGTGYRNTHVLANAPTKTNSKVTSSGSEGIEPYVSNYFRLKEKVNATVKNRNLRRLVEEKGLDTFEFWQEVNENMGSILFSDQFTFEEKMVFLTAREIDPMDIVKNACNMQKHVDQAISTNLFASPYSSVRKLNEPVIYTWANGGKTLYYLKSSSSAVIKAIEGKAMIVTKKDCPYCVMAKDFLQKKGYKYLEYDLGKIDPEYFHWDTVPRIWLDGHYIGTYEDMVEYFAVKESKQGVYIEQAESEECNSCHA